MHYAEVEIPAGHIIMIGRVARQGDSFSPYVGGADQIVILKETLESIDWNAGPSWRWAFGSYKPEF